MGMIPDSQVQGKKLDTSQSMADKSLGSTVTNKDEVADTSEKHDNMHSCSSSSCSLCYSSDETPTSSGSSTLPFKKLANKQEDDSEGESTDQGNSDNEEYFSEDELEEI